MIQNFDLKYRPILFEELVGETQQAMARKLSYLLDNGPRPRRILLAGSPGLGKTTTARILRRCYYCDRGPTSSPCGECKGCLKESSNYLELNAGAIEGVKHMRQIIDYLYTFFVNEGLQFLVFDEVELLSRDSLAVLRKPLEEPPAGVVFVLCTNEFKKLPAQIRSRCLCFHLEKISFDDRIKLANKVLAAEGANLNDEVIHEVSRESDGQVRDLLHGLELALAG